MKRFLALIYGITVYLFFFGTFVYAICFVGRIGVPKTIDSGRVSGSVTSALVDALLLSIFAIQYSVMARRGF